MTTFACANLVTGYTFISLVARGGICVGIVNIAYICIFRKTSEFKYILNIIKPMATSIKEKIITKVS